MTILNYDMSKFVEVNGAIKTPIAVRSARRAE